MLIVSYDFSDDKVRTRFAKFLSKYGVRLQYSVYEINNSQRLLNIVVQEIERYYAKQFSASDSVVIFNTNNEKTIKYGHAIHRDMPLVIID